MADVNLGPGATLRLLFNEMTVEAGRGSHRLALHYRAASEGLAPGPIALIAGTLRMQDAMGWLGVLHADQQLPISGTALHPRSVVLTTTITDAQLAGMETARNGTDLDLIVDLNVTLINVSPSDHAVGVVQDRVRVRAPIWAAHAERLGALVSVPLQMPLPLGDPTDLRAQAGGRLRSALQAQAAGRAEDALRNVLLALDLYDQFDPPASYDHLDSARHRDLEQRFAALRDALFSVSIGADPEGAVTADFRYSQRDVLAIIACVAALLQRH